MREESEDFQHYRILRQPATGKLWELGRGAMGVTYKALDTRLHVNVALKIINEHLFLEEAMRERFMREARAAASLFHRNVARVFYLGENGKNYFYAMEFIEGETLESLVHRNGPLTLTNALSIILQVSRALAAAHNKNLVHRDIKPANIMLVDEFDERAVVKLIDFGLAKSVAEDGASLVNTNTAGFLGTPLYASPEQCDERTPDIRSDIYSLGITLWYLLAGTPPFTGSLGRVFSQHLHRPPPFEDLPGHIPPVVHTLLGRMLAKDPAHRPSTPTVLRHEIEECMRQVLTNLPPTLGSGADTALAEAANRAVSDLPGTTADTDLLSLAVGTDAPTAPVPLSPANTELLSMAVVTDAPPAPVLPSPPDADLLSMAVGTDAPTAPVPLSPPEADLLSMAAVAHASPTPIRLTDEDEDEDETPTAAPPEKPPAMGDTALTALLPAGTSTDFSFADSEAPTFVPDEPVVSDLTVLPSPPPEAAPAATDDELESEEPEELDIEPAEAAEVELVAASASDWGREPEFDIPQVGSLLGGRYRLHQFIGEDETGRLFLAQSAADAQGWSTARIFHPEIADLAPEGYPELEMAYERLHGARHTNLLEMRELEVSGAHRFLVTAASAQDFSLLDVLRHRGNLTFRETICLARHAAGGVEHLCANTGGGLDLSPRTLWIRPPDGYSPASSPGAGANRRRLVEPVDSWAGSCVKLDPYPAIVPERWRETGGASTWAGARTQMLSLRTAASAAHRCSPVRAMAVLVYELLSGAPPPSLPGNAARSAPTKPLPGLSEAANRFLQRALADQFVSISVTQFCEDLAEAQGAGTRVKSSSTGSSAPLRSDNRMEEPAALPEAATLIDAPEVSAFVPGLLTRTEAPPDPPAPEPEPGPDQDLAEETVGIPEPVVAADREGPQVSGTARRSSPRLGAMAAVGASVLVLTVILVRALFHPHGGQDNAARATPVPGVSAAAVEPSRDDPPSNPQAAATPPPANGSPPQPPAQGSDAGENVARPVVPAALPATVTVDASTTPPPLVPPQTPAAAPVAEMDADVHATPARRLTPPAAEPVYEAPTPAPVRRQPPEVAHAKPRSTATPRPPRQPREEPEPAVVREPPPPLRAVATPRRPTPAPTKPPTRSRAQDSDAFSSGPPGG